MKVGIYIPNWIGDCVMALPFLAACKQKHQNDKIICIARQWVSPVLEKNSNIDELIIITKDQDKKIFELIGFLNLLRSKNIDIFYVLSDSWRTAFFAWISGANQRIGFDRYKKSILLTKSVNVNHHELHRSKKYLSLINKEKIDYEIKSEIELSKEEKLESKKYLNELKIKTFLGLFVGSNAQNRMISVDFWISICNKALEENMKILIFGSKKDEIISSEIINKLNNKNIFSFCGKISLRETISLISFSKGVIATDSGLGHVSANLGVPTISLFAAGNPLVTAPVGEKIKVINKNIYCQQCGEKKCKDPLICLNNIDPNSVWESYIKLIN